MLGQTLNIEDLNKYFCQKWMNTSSEFPNLGDHITYIEKKRAEEDTDSGIDKIMDCIKAFPKEDLDKRIWKMKVKSTVKEFALREYSAHEKIQLEPYINHFFSVMEAFTKEARKFDNKLSYLEIWQGMRNVWAMVLLQIMFKEEVCLTDSILSYSLLYPYTDNYLDNKKLAIKQKKAFNDLINKKLKGEEVIALDYISKQVVQLICKIENQFNREKYEEVFKSLLLIQEAQEKSLIQHGNKDSLCERQLLEISTEKGGTSVLADGYLVSGELSMEEIYFLFSFGVSLQIADDIQDVREDIENNHNTLVTKIAYKWDLDKLTNNLLNFTLDGLKDLEKINKDKNEVLERFIIKKSMNFIYFAIAKNKELHSEEFIIEFEKYLPYTLKYIENLNRKLNKKLKRVKRKLGTERFKEAMNYLL